MPSYEESTKTKAISESTGGFAYDRIFSIMRKNRNGKSFAYTAFKNESSYNFSINTFPSGDHRNIAGGNLSNLFFPFETRIQPTGAVSEAASGYMPGFDPTASGGSLKNRRGSEPNFNDLLPFLYDPDSSNFILDRSNSPSGDKYENVVSSDVQRFSDFSRYRDISQIRSIGLRTPVMLVGWGHDTSGKPFPNASGSSSKFKGGKDHGWEVDPYDYVAAPLDVRYDKRRNVWTATGVNGFYAQITGQSGVSPVLPSGEIPPYDEEFSAGVSGTTILAYRTIYSWREMFTTAYGQLTPSGSDPRRGTFTSNYATEINRHSAVSSGTNVWMFEKDIQGVYYFDVSVTNETDCSRHDMKYEGQSWDRNIVNWTSGIFYTVGQLVNIQGEYQFECVENHLAILGNKPPSSKWTSLEPDRRKGMKVRVPVSIEDTGGCLDTNDLFFVFDSDGHLVKMQPTDPCGSGEIEQCVAQYKYMSFQVIAQNKTGWDFVKSHPVI